MSLPVLGAAALPSFSAKDVDHGSWPRPCDPLRVGGKAYDAQTFMCCMEHGDKHARRGQRVEGTPALQADAQNNANLDQELDQVIEQDIRLRQREPSELAQLIASGHGVAILPEEDPADESLAKVAEIFDEKSKDEISDRTPEDLPKRGPLP